MEKKTKKIDYSLNKDEFIVELEKALNEFENVEIENAGTKNALIKKGGEGFVMPENFDSLFSGKNVEILASCKNFGSGKKTMYAANVKQEEKETLMFDDISGIKQFAGVETLRLRKLNEFEKQLALFAQRKSVKFAVEGVTTEGNATDKVVFILQGCSALNKAAKTRTTTAEAVAAAVVATEAKAAAAVAAAEAKIDERLCAKIRAKLDKGLTRAEIVDLFEFDETEAILIDDVAAEMAAEAEAALLEQLTVENFKALNEEIARLKKELETLKAGK